MNPGEKIDSDLEDLKISKTKKASNSGDQMILDEKQMRMVKMKETSSSRDILIGMLQGQLKKMEDLYKKSLDEQQEIRHKYGRVVQELGTLKIITNKLEADNKKLNRNSDQKDEFNEPEICKEKYEVMMKKVLDLENSHLERHENQLLNLMVHFRRIEGLLKEQNKKIDGFMIVLDTSKRKFRNDNDGSVPLIEFKNPEFSETVFHSTTSIKGESIPKPTFESPKLMQSSLLGVNIEPIRNKSVPIKRKSSNKLSFDAPKKLRSNCELDELIFLNDNVELKDELKKTSLIIKDGGRNEGLREKSSPDGFFSWYEDFDCSQIEERSLTGINNNDGKGEICSESTIPLNKMVSLSTKDCVDEESDVLRGSTQKRKIESFLEQKVTQTDIKMIQLNDLVSSVKKRVGFLQTETFLNEEIKTFSAYVPEKKSSGKDIVSNIINPITVHDLLTQLLKYNENYATNTTLNLQRLLEEFGDFNVSEIESNKKDQQHQINLENNDLNRIIDVQKVEIDCLKKDIEEKSRTFHESVINDRENLAKNAMLLQQYENEIDAINKKYTKAMEDLDVVMDGNKSLQNKVKNLQNCLIHHQEQSTILGIESRKSSEKIQEITSLLENADMKLIEKEEEIEKLKALNHEIVDLKQKNDELSKNLDEKDGFISNQTKEMKDLEEKLLEIMSHLDEELQENNLDKTTKNNNQNLQKIINSNKQIQQQFNNINSILSSFQVEKKKLITNNFFLQQQLKTERSSFKNEQETILNNLKHLHVEKQSLEDQLIELKEKLIKITNEENQEVLRWKSNYEDLQDKLKMCMAELKCLKENRKNNANLKVENGKLKNKLTVLNRRLIELIDARKSCVELKYSNERLKRKVDVLEKELKKEKATISNTGGLKPLVPINEERLDFEVKQEVKKEVRKLFDNFKFKENSDVSSKGSRERDEFLVKNNRVIESKGKIQDLKKSVLKSSSKPCKIPINKNPKLNKMGKIPVRVCSKCPHGIW
ncbi:putative leucine-rich repeat-containing protein DDB_G0290503 isoform X1 [Onthophagus taurus]|uniref:putative leucine-rich repeat-containing protein DDB_G0290503 isoform X1 n=1 Tax=Onthophagus taurus TaxID=166361 RepID=UPI0039BEC2C3